MSVRPSLLVTLPHNYDYAREALIGIGRFLREQTHWDLRRLQFKGALESLDADAVREMGFQGAVVFVGHPEDERKVKSLGIPAVNISARQPPSHLQRVSPNNFEAGRLGGFHLIERSYPRLAFFGLEEIYYSQRRMEGLLSAATEHNVPVVTRQFSFNTRLPGLVAALAALEKPVGVLTCHDAMGTEVIEAALESGFRVPEEVGVIGIDDSHIWCDTSRVTLSSVATEGQKVGYRAAKLVYDMARGIATPGEPLTITPTRVEARESTDLLPFEHPDVALAFRFLRDHAVTGVNVDEVVAHTGVSRRTFDRHVTRVLGRTPHQEIERIRLERACALLSSSHLTISEIADRSGFQQPGYFMRVFRDAMGMTPGEYREAHS